MLALSKMSKPLCHVLIVTFITLGLQMSTATAGIVSTEQALTIDQTDPARDRVQATLNREDVRSGLLAMGVAPDQVQARVDSLTDAEVANLSQRLDQLPAGGDFLGVVVLIFLVLLVTDILGFTDVYPFVKHTARVSKK